MNMIENSKRWLSEHRHGLYICPVQYDQVKCIGWLYQLSCATNPKYIRKRVQKITNKKQVVVRFRNSYTWNPIEYPNHLKAMCVDN